MLIKIIDPTAAREHEVTPHELYLDRRRLMASTARSLIAAGVSGASGLMSSLAFAAKAYERVPKGSSFDTKEPLTPLKDVTSYNNFYEFGTDKGDPKINSGTLRPRPWKITIDGEVDKPTSFDIDDFIKPQKLEERIYRLRCVEAWSMVIPWTGFPLADLIRSARPNNKAKFIAFTTLHDPVQMPGQKSTVLDWPYTEGLRLDEANHPLAFLAVGLYGDILPNQSGAPLRLVVPWKYGFKSIKSIVKITFTSTQPKTTWNIMAPAEYGFYSNVNPDVDHPRWSQSKERRIGELFKRKTQMFNGYDQVASLYTTLDMKKNF